MNRDFNKVICRKNNYAAKYDELELKFGRDDLVSMWVADMDFESAKPIKDAIIKRAEQGIFGYTSRPDSYYEAMTQWYKRRYDWNIDKSKLIHSIGVCTSLSIIVDKFTKPGDKIIVQSPVYYPFFDVVVDNERELVLNPLKKIDDNYVMDYEDLENKMDENIKFLILCNPHNPVGRVWTKEELTRLGEICLKHNVMVISDEIHGDLVYGDKVYTPFASISEELNNNTITCLSATKTFNIAGLQASFAIFPDESMYNIFERTLGILDIKRNNCFSLVAVEAAYRYGEEWLNDLLVYLKSNMDFLKEYCEKNIPEIVTNRPEGTYLAWLNCEGLGLSDEDLVDFMINKAKVGLDAGNWFGEEGKGYMRINVACPRTMLEQGLKNIEEAVKKYIRK
ncbi:MalY/PatB family protein [Anaeromicrobium sediminis]|uniref:cysteine-S-conjugate beta-lyase n=1 Tax=Anaeromicrobium sediminis TaxID=1478221 RepID=A0A267ME70_9FIRM|nr:MalY/PatB family protein [Anaeromicrobium sediminis]PAB57846.1 cystathionine beta-lyase [Anaeromicrobium sediminis]